MNLENIVTFNMENTGPCTQFHGGPNKQISSFDDLAKYVSSYSASMPYTIEIKRIVYTIDKDKYVGGGRSTLGHQYSLNNHPIVAHETSGQYKILVGNKIVYPADIIKFLTEQYGSSLDFDTSAAKKPVMLDNVHEQIQVCDNNKKVRSAKWHYLTDTDIFVDRNLKKLFGIGIGQVPFGLVEFFRGNGNNQR